MMDNMEVRDIMQKKPPLPAEKGSVDCCSSTTLIVPLPFSIMREVWVRMVKVCDHNEPV